VSALLVLGSLLLPRWARADDVPREAVVAVVPFADANPNRIHLNLAPEGQKPLVWMLDTGASLSLMTPRVARKAGVAVRREKDSPYRRSTRLGRDVQFWVDVRRSDTAGQTTFQYAVLGGDFLDHYVVELDLPARRVRFLDPRKYRVPKKSDAPRTHIVPLRIIANRIAVPVTLDHTPTQVLLDTGAPTSLILSGKAAKRAGISWEDGLPMRFGTAVGPMDTRIVDGVGVDFAGSGERPMPIEVAPRGWYNMAGDTDSVIGLDALRGLVVRIDYRLRRMWVHRVEEREPMLYGVPWAPERAAGLTLYPRDGRYQVLSVLPTTPAAALGLTRGDELAGAAGEPFDIEAYLRRVVAGQSVAVRRGGVLRQLLPAVRIPEAAQNRGG